MGLINLEIVSVASSGFAPSLPATRAPTAQAVSNAFCGSSP